MKGDEVMVTNEEIAKFIEEHPNIPLEEISRAMVIEAVNNTTWADASEKERILEKIMNMDIRPTLYILCGPSGCGKSTWAFNFIKDNDIRWVSRDDIRFSMLKEDENYFAHEKEAFRKFVDTIAATLIDGFDVIADATHLNEISRYKLTRAIDERIKSYKIVYVVFYATLETCLKQNSNRNGRERVPEKIIEQMFENFQTPELTEDMRAVDIIEVYSND